MALYAVSGSSGFIGQHLVKRLRDDGHGVFSIPRELFRNPELLEHMMQESPPDYVIHLAAYGNHSKQTEPYKMVDVNLINTLTLLSAIEFVPIKGFINIGSSSEYGIKDKPMKETDLLETDTFYGATKAASTMICRAFAKYANKNVVTVRPFSVYGPGEADFRFIPTMCRALLTQEPTKLAMEPVHDWIYVQDFIDGVLKVVENVDKLSGQVVNIGTGTQYTNLEVVNYLELISDKHLIYEPFGMSDMRVFDNKSWVADNTKLKSLGWKQKHTLQQGLKLTYEAQRPKTEST